MASTFSPSLRIELIGDGDQSGIWGQTTNTNLGTLIEQAIAGVVSITMIDANYTMTNFNGVSDEARNQVLVLTGTNTAQRNLIAPLVEKTYIVKNSTTGGFAVQIIGSSGTGVVIPNGVTATVYCDGTNFYSAQINTIGNQTINGNLSVTGTALVTGATTLSSTLGVSGATTLAAASATSLAVTGTTTLNTSLTGLAKLTSGVVSAATAGTDYVAPGTATTFTALQTFAGTSSNAALITNNILETATVSATASTGTINFDLTTQSVLYYTTAATGNWTLNFRGSSGTSLNSIMSNGQSISATFLSTQGGTAYYNSAVTIDGTSVTPKWQNGVAPSSGNTSSIDIYSYVIIKTASATFTVLATATKFS
jgi:hypothetical protein